MPRYNKTEETCATQARCAKKVSGRQRRRRIKQDKKRGKSKSPAAKSHKVYVYRKGLTDRENKIQNAIARAKARKFTPYKATESKSKLPPLPRGGDWTRFVGHNKRIYIGKLVCRRSGHRDIGIQNNIDLFVMELHPNEQKKDARLKNPFMAVPRLQIIETAKKAKKTA